MTEPYAGYPGMTYAEHFGQAAFIARARTEGLRDFGTVLAPQSAFYLIQGMETLSLRMERHLQNAKSVLEFLSNHTRSERTQKAPIEAASILDLDLIFFQFLSIFMSDKCLIFGFACGVHRVPVRRARPRSIDVEFDQPKPAHLRPSSTLHSGGANKHRRCPQRPAGAPRASTLL